MAVAAASVCGTSGQHSGKVEWDHFSCCCVLLGGFLTMQTDERSSRPAERRRRLGLIVAISLLCVTVLCLLPPIPLGPGYHDFIDKRVFLRIPNYLDVLSNIPFMIVGLWGLLWLLGRSS